MSIAIGATILEDRTFVASFVKLSRERLRESRLHTAGVLDAAGIKYERGCVLRVLCRIRCRRSAVGSTDCVTFHFRNAGFFLFIDLAPWLEPAEQGQNREFVLAEKLLRAGVGLHPGEEHAEREGQFRLVFSQDRDTLDEGLKR